MSMDAPSHSGIPVCDFDYDTALTNNQMKKVDYYAMKKFQLPCGVDDGKCWLSTCKIGFKVY